MQTSASAMRRPLISRALISYALRRTGCTPSPQTTVSPKRTGLRLRPGFKPPGRGAFLGRKVNEGLGKAQIARRHAAHSQDLIDFSAVGGNLTGSEKRVPMIP